MIDLHTHSNHSDGSDSPSRLVDLAAEAGCSAIALTDHDSLEGIPEALIHAEKQGVELVVGVELSCHVSQRNLHVLGHFVDHTHSIFNQRLELQQDFRNERNVRLCERLIELGMPVSLEEVTEIAGGEEGSIGRPHFAAALMKHGYVQSIDEAFLRFLSDGMPAYVERQELPADVAIHWIKEAGGVATWAHPIWRGAPQEASRAPIESILEELVAAGLTGIEAYYSRYDSQQRKDLVRLARKYDLVPTGGSDYHGTYKPDLSIGIGVGDLSVPNSILDELKSQLPT